MSLTLKQILKWGIAGLLVWWLIGHVDWITVLGILKQVSLPLIGLYCVLQLVGNLLSAAKWQMIAKTQGFTFSLRDGFFSYLSGAFINNFLPSTIGGDTYRTLWMSEPGKRFEAFTVVLFDRLSGLLALFLSAAVGLFLLPWQAFIADPILIIIGLVIISMTVCILISLFWFTGLFELVLLIVDWVPFAIFERIKQMIERFRPLIEIDLYLKSLLYSLVFLGIGVGLSNLFLWQALGAPFPLLTFFGCIFLATLIANIPISVNNIGVKEWSYILVFGLVGASPELAVTAALLSRLLQMLLSFIAVPAYLRFKRVANKQALSLSQVIE